MSTHEIKGLTQTIGQEVAKLRDKAVSVKSDLQAGMQEAHEALTYVGDMTKTLRNAVSDLRGVLGQETNNPPPEAEKK